MDQFRFDALTKTFARSTSRRSVIMGTAGGALAGLVALVGVKGGGAQTATGTVSCNSHEKCEAKCGKENAICCNGKCITTGCGPDRALSQQSCKCCRKDEFGQTSNSGCREPKYCGA